jgi:RNA polymerase sigma factor (sigma-70 family)
MTSQPHFPSPEQLLAHAEWAQALAQRLVGDASTADDVVQETWLAAMGRPPRAGEPLRPWLSRVLGNVVRQRWRSEDRRERREREASREEALPSAAELTHRTEAQRSLMDAILQLGEELRSVVLLR